MKESLINRNYLIKVNNEYVPNLAIAADMLNRTTGYLRVLICKHQYELELFFGNNKLEIIPYYYDFKTDEQIKQEKDSNKKVK